MEASSVRWPRKKEPTDTYTILREAYAAGEAAKRVLIEQQTLLRETLRGGLNDSNAAFGDNVGPNDGVA